MAATGALILFSGVVADPMTGDPNQDEIFANRSESFIDPSPPSGPIAARSADAEALTAAVKTSSKPVVAEWGQAGANAIGGWAEPGIDSFQQAASRYEPRLSFTSADRVDGPQAQLRLEFGPGGKAKRPAVPRYQRLGEVMGMPPALADKEKGRWFLFAATGGDALGMNMLRSRPGELRRTGWSAEKIAAVGDAQLGFGWRKGPLQASVSFVEREISAYGKSADEQFVAFTFSIRPDDAKTGGNGGRDYWIKKAEQGPGRQPYRH